MKTDERSDCGQCWVCLERAGVPIEFMIVCAQCGNKRCPRATDHELVCTRSNRAGQPGSAYEHGSGEASARRDPLVAHIHALKQMSLREDSEEEDDESTV